MAGKLSNKGRKHLQSLAKKRLRYKGRFISMELENKIRESKKAMYKKDKKKKYVRFQTLVDSYFENLEVGIEETKDYKADRLTGIEDMSEFELDITYYQFFDELMNVIRNIQKTPHIYVKRYGSTKFETADMSQLKLILDEFRQDLFGALSKYEADKNIKVSPQWSYVLKVFKLSNKAFVDLNDVRNIDPEILDYL